MFLRVSFALWPALPRFFALVAMVVFIRDNNRIARSVSQCSGFTLLEILVVLLLLGIGFAVAVPAFRAPRDADDGVQGVIDAARRTAVRRAETLLVSFDASGAWLVDAGDPDALSSRGRVERALAVPFRVRVTPLGSCMLETVDPALRIDAVTCRLETRVRS